MNGVRLSSVAELRLQELGVRYVGVQAVTVGSW